MISNSNSIVASYHIPSFFGDCQKYVNYCELMIKLYIYIHRLAIDPTAYGLRACLVSPTCRDGIAGDLVVTATVASFAKDLNAAQHVDSSGIAGRSKLPQETMLGIQSLAC